jgi:hypothetical protein
MSSYTHLERQLARVDTDGIPPVPRFAHQLVRAISDVGDLPPHVDRAAVELVDYLVLFYGEDIPL